MAGPIFYIDSATGDNRNAGDDKTPVESTNGSWNSTTNVFTAASGTPFSGASVGDFAAVMNDGATVAAFIQRIDSIGGGGSSITLSTSTGAGSKPTTSATGRTCRLGGKFAGPDSATNFPFSLSFYQSLRLSGTPDPPVTYWKNSATLSITSTLTFSNFHHVVGYSTSPGDGGRVTVTSSNTTGTANAGLCCLENFIFTNSAGSGTPYGVTASGYAILRNVVAHSTRGTGILATGLSSAANMLIRCEAYGCNTSNTAGLGGINGQDSVLINCIAHDNTGSNNAGLVGNGPLYAKGCVFESNQLGARSAGNAYGSVFDGCDFYNNTSHGYYQVSNDLNRIFVNCNFVKNGGYGLRCDSSTVYTSLMLNCGFGSGTQANVSGNVSFGSTNSGLREINSITYPADVTPWTDPANGDFTIDLAEAINAGWAEWVQTAASYAGTSGYASIGAAQPQAGGGGGGTTTVIARRGIGGM